MLSWTRVITWAIVSAVCPVCIAQAQTSITVDAGNLVADISARPIGVNVSYLMDDDSRVKHTRGTAEALKAMGVKYLRYPGGEKSDNHLWSVPPFTAPRITAARTNAWPANDTRFFETGGTGKASLLDFDEFMAMSKAANAEPILCVAFDGMYKPSSADQKAPAKAALKQAAVEWVRYANVTKKYGVKYWTLGNETDYGESYAGNNPGAATFAADAAEFAQAMKAVDPSIKVGVNGKSQAWFVTILSTAAPHLDYLEVHTYPTWDYTSYEAYRTRAPDFTGGIDAAVNAINSLPSNLDRDRFFVTLTEYNAMYWGTGSGWANVNDLGHALAVFDMTGQFLARKKLRFSLLWNTRWVDNDLAAPSQSGRPPEVSDALDRFGNFNPTGRAIAIWGQFMKTGLMAVNGQTTGIRAYASATPSSGELAIFLLNKETTARSVTVRVNNHAGPANAARWVFTGKGHADLQPQWQEDKRATLSGGRIELSLPALSITVLDFVSPTSSLFRYSRQPFLWPEIFRLHDIKGKYLGFPAGR